MDSNTFELPNTRITSKDETIEYAITCDSEGIEKRKKWIKNCLSRSTKPRTFYFDIENTKEEKMLQSARQLFIQTKVNEPESIVDKKPRYPKRNITTSLMATDSKSKLLTKDSTFGVEYKGKISNLPNDVTEQDIIDLIQSTVPSLSSTLSSNHKPSFNVYIPKNRIDRTPLSFGFITVDSEQTLTNIIQAINGYSYGTVILRVEVAENRKSFN